jgi:hypothetical protein
MLLQFHMLFLFSVPDVTKVTVKGRRTPELGDERQNTYNPVEEIISPLFPW